MMRANGGGYGGEEAPSRTMSTAHLSGAVSPGKAARNPQELVAFLRAKRKSSGSVMMDAPTSGSPMDLSQGPPPAPPPPMFAGGPRGPPPPLPPGGLQGGGMMGGGDPMGAPNPLLSEIELAARARQDRVVVPQAGGYNPLLSEIENAARARQDRVPVLQQNAGANPLLDEIRAAGGSSRGGGGGIDQWLQQSGGVPPNQGLPGAWQGQLVPEQQQNGADMRLGESAVSPTLTDQRSASPPPPSALSMQQRGTFNVVTQQFDNDGEPVNYVRELLMQRGLVNKPKTLMNLQQAGGPMQEQQPQFDPSDHVSQLLMRHDFHNTKDVYSMAEQVHQEAQRAPQMPQYWQQSQGQGMAPPGAQGGLGQVPGMAPQQPQQHSTIWEQLGQVQSQRQSMPQRTASVYQGPSAGRTTFQVALQKAIITPGGQPTFGMSLKWVPAHSRIEVTNVPPRESRVPQPQAIANYASPSHAAAVQCVYQGIGNT